MRVLVACEESQRVCSAFRERGHEAYSCDVIECSGGHPEWHIQGDVLEVLNPKEGDFTESDLRTFQHTYHYVGIGFDTCDGHSHCFEGQWDLIIAHPPCTYISNAGARWLFPGGKLNRARFRKGQQAVEFFMKFLTAQCDHIAIENPFPSPIYGLPKASQVIQPYEFGHPYSKKTCLWLVGLEKLRPTKIVRDYVPFCPSGSYSHSHDEKYKGASRVGGAAKTRSRTFQGIADAMAEQWGHFVVCGETDPEQTGTE